MGLRTPLHDTHVAAGAKIVDFAGWDMPLHYGSQLEEHRAVRADCGLFDVSHMRAVDLHGADAAKFLSLLLANDVAKLDTPGRALYSCMLNPSGGVIDDLITYYFTPQHYRLVVNAGTADKDIAWMRTQAEGFAVHIDERKDVALIAVQGPRAPERLAAALPETAALAQGLKPFNAAWLAAAAPAQATLVARTGYTGEDGFELMLPASSAVAVWNALVAAGGRPCGLGARDTLRLEAGMNLYGQDMDESVNPLESGLAWTVDLRNAERDFIGRRALEAAPREHALHGLLLTARGVLRAHQIVHTAHGAGLTTSGSFAPSLDGSIALARLPAAVQPGDTVEVEIRAKRLPALVVKPPFVRKGKTLVSPLPPVKE
ncbi:MAG: glycine cleavage system aminomethyltransferase GcvT [Rhodocyclaceae bacterium]|nr:glycine cleavage system aminomethyltransferase GcvT [Rhodocyclaceae bacterium]MBX3670316.1 glycine cleavage system aminomethyltransferase GcvT [Rhodocyclaceae bacterium]